MGKEKQGRRGSNTRKEKDTAEEDPRMDLRTIMKEFEFLGSSHMTYKERKELENRKVVSLGGKPPKKQRLPLSVARVQMKKQKERDAKMLEENMVLGRFCGNRGIGNDKQVGKQRPENRVLKSTVGHFKNGVLDVKDLLRSSKPRATESKQFDGKRKGGKKGGKRKDGKKGGKKRH